MARIGPPTSLRAKGKAPAIQVKSLPPAKTDEKLVCWLQAEELVVEEARQDRDVATLEVVMEAAGPLTWG